MCSETSRHRSHQRTISVPSPPKQIHSRNPGRYGGNAGRSISLAAPSDPIALQQLRHLNRPPSKPHDQLSNVSHSEGHKQRVPDPHSGRTTAEPGPRPPMTIDRQPSNRGEPQERRATGPRMNGTFPTGKRKSLRGTKLLHFS